MNAMGYSRVSTEEQARHGVSMDNQDNKIRLQAELSEYHLVDIIRDPGRSAKDMNRPGIRRVIEAVKAGEIDAVIIHKLDRLTRSVADLDSFIRLLNKKGVALISVKDSIDTKTAGGRMVLNVLASISQWEREAIGERTAEALRHKRSRGEYTGGDIPFGYDLDRDGIHLVENKAEKKAIRLMIELRGRGYSYRAIARRLAGGAVDDQVLGPFAIGEGVLQHAQDAFLAPALAAQLKPGRSLNFFVHVKPRLASNKASGRRSGG